jgi:hypothetical protein
VTPVMFRAWAELRGRWRSWAALAVFLGIFGGAVKAISAGARRTDSAYERFLVASRAWDVQVPNFPAVFAPSFAEPDLNQVEGLPMLALAATLLLSNLIAAVPGRIAAGSQPAAVLRSE